MARHRQFLVRTRTPRARLPADGRLELNPRELAVHTHSSIATDGCVLLEYMPSAVYVHVKDCGRIFLKPGADAPQLGDLVMRGVLAVLPVSRPWEFSDGTIASVT